MAIGVAGTVQFMRERARQAGQERPRARRRKRRPGEEADIQREFQASERRKGRSAARIMAREAAQREAVEAERERASRRRESERQSLVTLATSEGPYAGTAARRLLREEPTSGGRQPRLTYQQRMAPSREANIRVSREQAEAKRRYAETHPGVPRQQMVFQAAPTSSVREVRPSVGGQIAGEIADIDYERTQPKVRGLAALRSVIGRQPQVPPEQTPAPAGPVAGTEAIDGTLQQALQTLQTAPPGSPAAKQAEQIVKALQGAQLTMRSAAMPEAQAPGTEAPTKPGEFPAARMDEIDQFDRQISHWRSREAGGARPGPGTAEPGGIEVDPWFQRKRELEEQERMAGVAVRRAGAQAARGAESRAAEQAEYQRGRRSVLEQREKALYDVTLDEKQVSVDKMKAEIQQGGETHKQRVEQMKATTSNMKAQTRLAVQQEATEKIKADILAAQAKTPEAQKEVNSGVVATIPWGTRGVPLGADDKTWKDSVWMGVNAVETILKGITDPVERRRVAVLIAASDDYKERMQDLDDLEGGVSPLDLVEYWTSNDQSIKTVRNYYRTLRDIVTKAMAE